MAEREPETKAFRAEVLASISSGIMLCPFPDLHEAAEFLMGHPIWTHQFASRDLADKMRQAVLDQCPDMPTELVGVTEANYQDTIRTLMAQFSALVTIRKGNGETATDPMDGLDPDRTIVFRAQSRR